MTSPEQKHHLFAGIPDRLPDELVTELAGNGHVRIERIVSWGQASPEEGWYDQSEDEWVLLLKARRACCSSRAIEPCPCRPVIISISRRTAATGWSGPIRSRRASGWRFSSAGNQPMEKAAILLRCE